MANNSQKKSVIAEPEIGGNGIGHSDAQVGKGGAASPAELATALEKVLARNAQLEAELAAEKAESKGSEGIKELAAALMQLVPKQPAGQMQDADNINRSTDFKGTKATVDGRSLMEAQQTLQMFRNEPKHPISISKTIANSVGPNLSITVNGVRVSIPCDGKTYYINESHWEAARERLAKLDMLTANTEPQVIEIG
jgi:hypothetical protein